MINPISPEFESLQILPVAAEIKRITDNSEFNSLMTASYLSLFDGEGEPLILLFETDNLKQYQEVKNGED